MYRMVSAQIFCRLVVLTMACFMVSCSAFRTVQIEVLEPSVVTLDKEGKIGFLDRQLVYKSDSILFLYYPEEVSRKELVTLFSDGLRTALIENGAADTMLSMIEEHTIYLEDNTIPSPLTAAKIHEICKEFDLDYIVSLECHHYVFGKHISSLKSEWLIRLYSRFTGECMDYIIQDDQLNNPVQTDYFVEEVMEKAWDQGSRYAKRIIPCWVEDVRRVYDRGKVLGMGDVFFRNKQNEEAEKLWQAVLRMSPTQAIRAGINLAWLYENSGNFEQAEKNLQEMKELAEKKKIFNKDVVYLNQYLQIIRKRIKDVPLLEKQLKK